MKDLYPPGRIAAAYFWTALVGSFVLSAVLIVIAVAEDRGGVVFPIASPLNSLGIIFMLILYSALAGTPILLVELLVARLLRGRLRQPNHLRAALVITLQFVLAALLLTVYLTIFRIPWPYLLAIMGSYGIVGGVMLYYLDYRHTIATTSPNEDVLDLPQS